jgi:protein SCO1/2
VLGAFLLAVLVMRLLGAWSSAAAIPVLWKLPAFELTDQTGKPVHSHELAGHVWIASFIYTTCPGPCPRVVQRQAEVQRELAGQGDLRAVSISVDPAADTPAVLAAYGGSRNIDPEHWKLLTGEPNAVIDLVRNGFRLAVARVDELEPDALSSQGPVVHSVHLVLVDRAMQVRGFYESTDGEAMKRLVADARRLLRDPSV